MTLSRWLRDYLYIPLGGNRSGKLRTLANLMITMLLGGLWHGASWTFVIWGGLHGLYLVIERIGLSRWKLWQSPSRAMAFVRLAVVFHLVCLAWIFFRAKTFVAAWQMLGNLAHGAIHALANFAPAQHTGLALLFIALMIVHAVNAHRRVKERLGNNRGPAFVAAMTAALLLLVLFTPNHSAPFIYFQF